MLNVVAGQEDKLLMGSLIMHNIYNVYTLCILLCKIFKLNCKAIRYYSCQINAVE